MEMTHSQRLRSLARFAVFAAMAVACAARSAEIEWGSPVDSSIGTIGTPTSVRVPMPAGFVDPRIAIPKVADYITGTLTPPGRKLLAIAMPKEALKALESSPSMTDPYFLVITPVSGQNVARTPSEFGEFKAIFAQAFATMPRYLPAAQAQLDTVGEDASRATGARMDLKVGEFKVLDDPAQGSDWTRRSVMAKSQWTIDGKTETALQVVTQTWVHVRGKFVGILAYRRFDTDADHGANVELAEALTRQIISLNR